MKNEPTTTNETRIDSYELDLFMELIADVNLYRDNDFRFGPYIITVDVQSISNDMDGKAWTSTTKRDHINSRTKKVVAEAVGRAMLHLPPAGQGDEGATEFRQALRDIKSGFNS